MAVKRMPRRVVALLMALFLLCVPLPALAADVPERHGTVTDPVGLFSESEARTLNEVLNEGTYAMNVLTAAELTADAIERLVEEAYDAWTLSERDILVVISTNPNRIQMFYDNVGLKAAVYAIAGDYDGDGQVEKPGTELIDKHFVPHAKNGAIADGVVELYRTINGLTAPQQAEMPPAQPAVPEEAPSGSPTENTSENPLESPTESPSSSFETTEPVTDRPIRPDEPAKPSLWQQAVPVLIGAAVIAAVVFAIRTILVRRRLRRVMEQSEELEQRAAALMYRLTAQELEPGFAEGQTKRSVEEARAALETVRSGAEQYKREAAAKMKRRLAEAEQAMPVYRQELDELEALLERFRTIRSEVEASAAQAQALSGETAAAVEQLMARTGYPLNAMRERLAEAGRLSEEAKRLEQQDVLEARDVIERALGLLREVESDAARLLAECERAAGLPQRIAATRQQMDEIRAKERLLLAEDDPYSEFGPCERVLIEVGQRLRSGETAVAAKLAAQIESQLDAALQQIRETVQMRDRNRERLAWLAAREESFGGLDGEFRQETERLRRFDPKHWSELPGQHQDLQKRIGLWRQEIAAAEELNSFQVQRYRKAEREITELEGIVQPLEEGRQQLFRKYDELQQQWQSFEQKFREQSNEIADEIRAVRNAQGEMDKQRSRIERLEAEAGSVLRSAPVDLDEVSRTVQLFQSEAAHFVEQVKQYLREKARAEQRLEDLQRDWSRRERQYRERINVRRYTGDGRSHTANAERLIAVGRFAEAFRELEQSQQLIKRMEREHQSVVDEERRRQQEAERQRREEERRAEEERRRIESQHSNSSSSGGTGSGSGRDNSGSSW